LWGKHAVSALSQPLNGVSHGQVSRSKFRREALIKRLISLQFADSLAVDDGNARFEEG
jgi:hypothetical protein